MGVHQWWMPAWPELLSQSAQAPLTSPAGKRGLFKTGSARVVLPGTSGDPRAPYEP